METKKISFGFSKTSKQAVLVQNAQVKEEPKLELIKCFEENTLKLVEEKEEPPPLVIPMKEGGKTSAALASLMKRRAVLLGEEELETKTRKDGENKIIKNDSTAMETEGEIENLEKRAARELLAESQNLILETKPTDTLVLPLIKADELPLDGAAEPTLQDYEEIPISEYGKALLRGMGWTEPPKKDNEPIPEGPVMRPKGMGLGVDKVLKPYPLLVKPEPNELLNIKKNAYVRIIAGKHKGLYGQIIGLDGAASRAFVKMALSGQNESFNEFLCQPVSKQEYTQYSKVINSQKYQEYKDMENKPSTSSSMKKEIFKSEKHQFTESERCQYKDSDIKNVKIKQKSSSDENNKFDRRSSHQSRENKQISNTKSYRTNNDSEISHTSTGKSYNSQSHNKEYKQDKYSSSHSVRKRSLSDDDVERSSERKHRTHNTLISKDDSSSLDSSSSDGHKLSRKKNKKKSKHKKSKSKYKTKRREKYTSSYSGDERSRKNHKKKTKKSKRERSRS